MNNNGIEDKELKEHSLSEAIVRLVFVIFLTALTNIILFDISTTMKLEHEYGIPLIVFIIFNMIYFWDLVFCISLIRRDIKYNKLIKENKEIDYSLLNERTEFFYKVRNIVIIIGAPLAIIAYFVIIFISNIKAL